MLTKRNTLWLCLAQLIVACLALDSCPSNIQSVGSFDAQRFAGTWHLYAHVGHLFADQETTCKQILWIYNERHQFLDGIMAYKVNGIRDTAEIIVTPLDNGVVHCKAGPFEADTKILDLVYDEYSITYHCGAIPHIWILTREAKPDPVKMNGYIQNAIQQFGADFTSQLTLQDQSNCY